LGALLRREDLYHSTLSKWREQREAGKLDGSYQKQRAEARAEMVEMKRLRCENRRLKKELEQAEAIIALQKNVATLLETFEK
jgi:transposase-like protein